MLTWLQNNLGTIVVAVIVFGILAAVAVKMLKDKKQGKSSCGNNCSHCAMHGQCHSNGHPTDPQ